MRDTKVPEGGAKRKLLDAAEALVAAKGFDSVSVRDVTGAVRANVASINYHFGSREALMDMIAAHVLDPLCAERMRAVESAGNAETLARAYVMALPLAATSTGIDANIFPRLAGRILALPDAALPPVLAAARRDVSARYLEAIAKTAKAKESDWAFFEAGLAQSLIAVKDCGRMEALLEDWIAFGVRGFSAAASPKKKKQDSQGMLFDL